MVFAPGLYLDLLLETQFLFDKTMTTKSSQILYDSYANHQKKKKKKIVFIINYNTAVLLKQLKTWWGEVHMQVCA